MLLLASVVTMIKCIVFSSVVFVWVVRYQNIVQEFIQFGYPAWLRDSVGILKLTFVVFMMNTDPALGKMGAFGICSLMIAALFSHIKIKNPFFKMLPAMSLLLLSAFILMN